MEKYFQMFSRTNYEKLKTNLKLSGIRLKNLQQKKSELSVRARDRIAALLSTGKEEQARIQVCHIINEDYLIEVLEIVETYCDLLLARFSVFEKHTNPDESFWEAVAGLIWVTPRLWDDVPELRIISKQLTAKYGISFTKAVEGKFPITVNDKLACRASIARHPNILIDKYMEEISKCYLPSQPSTSGTVAYETPNHEGKPVCREVKIAYVNIRSLPAHLEQVKNFLRNSDIDVLGLGETWLDPKFADCQIAITGYKLFRCDKSRHSGGVVVYVKDGMCCLPMDCLQSQRLNSIWLFLKDSVSDRNPKVMGFLYQPPRSDDLDFYASLAGAWDLITRLKLDAFVLGDFNMDYSLGASQGKRLQKLATLYDFNQVIEDPTRIAGHSSTTVDLIFTNSLRRCRTCGVLHISGLADHGVIYVTVF